MALTWYGDRVKAKVRQAALYGVDKTMSEAVIAAKQSHPGWKNVTGTAEGSVSVVKFAEPYSAGVRGLWGSAAVHYVIWLELKRGSFLRNAADRIYPRLAQHIREAFAR